MKHLTTIAFDADDTLWHTEQYFQLTAHHFKLLLRDFADPDHLGERILAAERRNIKHFGYGVKSFTLSMIETAIEVTDGKVPASIIQQIVDAGRDMLANPVELMDHVKSSLQILADRYCLAIITKGDLLDQERKVAQSGLGELFDMVEIVSEKDPETYKRIFDGFKGGAGQTMMVGNSLKSDIVPALEAGAWATYIPHHLTWELEIAEEPENADRYTRLEHLGQLPPLLDCFAD